MKILYEQSLTIFILLFMKQVDNGYELIPESCRFREGQHLQKLKNALEIKELSDG